MLADKENRAPVDSAGEVIITMTRKVKHSSDRGYRFLLGYIELFIELVRNTFPDAPWLDLMRFDEAERIPRSYILDDFKEKISDVVYRIPFKDSEAFLYILIEHQSTVDFSMPFRLLLALVHIWLDYFNQAPKEKRTRKSFRFPPVFALVLYNGKAKWTVARRFSELVAHSDLFGDFIPDFVYPVLKIRELSEEEIEKYGASWASIFYLEQSMVVDDEQRREKFEKAVERLGEVEQKLVKALGKWLAMRYASCGLDTTQVEELLAHQPEEVSKMTEGFIEEIRRQERLDGKLAAKQDAVLKVLRTRFGRVPGALRKEIEKVKKLKVLDELLSLAVTCKDLAEFTAEIEELMYGKVG